MMRETQDAVFNRTGRIEIPLSHIRRKVEQNRFRFEGFHTGAWCENLPPSDLEASVLHVDIHCLLLLKRCTIDDVTAVLEADWKGVDIEVPKELTKGDYRVTMQVTIAFPGHHPDAGRIVARSSDIVLIEGEGDGGEKGPSILPVRPDKEGMPDLSRLEITEDEGPVLYVNACLTGLTWKDLARDPKFRFGVFSGCVREILKYLVFNTTCQETWGKEWLDLEGVKGREVPEVEELPIHEAWKQANDFAGTACEGLLQHLNLAERFLRASNESKVN